MNQTLVEPGLVIMRASDQSPLREGMYRVLEVMPHLDQVTIIPIPATPRETPGRKQKSYYARGFFLVKLSLLQFWIESVAVRQIELTLPSHWHLSDNELHRLHLPVRSIKIYPEELHKSPSVLRRDRKWQLIEPLIPAPAGTGKRTPDLTCLDALVRDHAKAANVSAGQVFDALHRYYVFVCSPN